MTEQEFNDKVKSYIQKATARGTSSYVQNKFITERKKEFMSQKEKTNDQYDYTTINGKLVRIDNETGEVKEVYNSEADTTNLTTEEKAFEALNREAGQFSPDGTGTPTGNGQKNDYSTPYTKESNQNDYANPVQTQIIRGTNNSTDGLQVGTSEPAPQSGWETTVVNGQKIPGLGTRNVQSTEQAQQPQASAPRSWLQDMSNKARNSIFRQLAISKNYI